jgi:hypothetical protein
MELRSGRRLRRSSPPHGIRSQRTDLICALPDEMLLQVLARLGCIRAAAQTSLLSRRWRGLWIGLWNGPTDRCFECATSFNIATRHISLKPPPAGEFAALESLSVTTGHIIDLGPFLVRCPRLRVLSITYPHNNSTISIPDDEFPALEELSLSALTIDIMAPCSTAATACAC